MQTDAPRTSLPRPRRLVFAAALPAALVLSAALVGACSEKTESQEFHFEETITWHEHIAPLVNSRCGSCHTEDNIGPFSIETYEEAREWAPKMEREIKNGTMPPWAAEDTEECTPPGSFKDDLRLTAYEKALFSQWIADGRPEGDPKDAGDLPAAPQLSLAAPDRKLTIPSPVAVEGTDDQFVCFVIDPEITEPVWLTGTQVEPGNTAIVHHALTFLDRAGDGEAQADENGQYPCFGAPMLSQTTLLSAWAPGSVASETPENVGTPLLPGDKLVVQVHYHPTGDGVEVDDSTRIDLKWTTEEPDYVSNILLIGNIEDVDPGYAGGKGFGLTTGPDFEIPAGATEHVEVNRVLLPDGGDAANRVLPLRLWVVGTHMHYVGTDMKISVEKRDGEEQCLIQTPRWDFNWQRGYYFDGDVKDLPFLNLGDILTMRCTYNNSMDNPHVRKALDDAGLDAPHDVVLGEETLDEMCLGVFGVAVPKEFKEAIGL